MFATKGEKVCKRPTGLGESALIVGKLRKGVHRNTLACLSTYRHPPFPQGCLNNSDRGHAYVNEVKKYFQKKSRKLEVCGIMKKKFFNFL